MTVDDLQDLMKSESKDLNELEDEILTQDVPD